MRGYVVIITDDQYNSIIALHSRGATSNEIAAEVGISSYIASKTINEYREAIRTAPIETPAPAPANGNGYSRIAGDFRTFGAQYLRCPLCKFRWWNAYGAVMYCPRCNHQRPIVKYSPSSAG